MSQISEQPLFVPGVWGPCLSAMVPGLWLNEGGQSATGRLVSPLSCFIYHLSDLIYAAQLRDDRIYTVHV